MFADLKNDYVFRRIFLRRPDLLRGLLNDLLERRGAREIAEIEYLPSEQLPLVEGAKLSVLDVRCRERDGATFVVEMQLLHTPGFENRVVYNACRSYAGQLKGGDPFAVLADVVAISICDFALWPDAKQDAAGLPRVPMLSRWNMSERNSRAPGLLQVQYAFLELPKLPPGPPRTPTELWAWLFVHAKRLTAYPDLPQGPYREVLEMANEASFTQLEHDAYFKAAVEIQQVRDLLEAELAKGIAKGRIEGRIEALIGVLERRGLTLDQDQRVRIATCTDTAVLSLWLDRAFTARTADEVFAAWGPEGRGDGAGR